MKVTQIAIAALVTYLVYMLYNNVCNARTENYAEFVTEEDTTQPVVEEDSEIAQEPTPEAVVPYAGDSDNLDLASSKDAHISMSQCKSPFLSTNLLPKDDPKMEDASEFAPSLEGQNFVDSYKYVFGSQSQSLRNANYQLRSDPPNPQKNVCPWMQTTISKEERRTLDIGAVNDV